MDISKIDSAVTQLFDSHIEANIGLPENLFLLISSLVPIPNVDLLITNEKNQILLSWRDDEFYGKGWHIPGGCIRFGETMQQRIQKTALAEIGTNVIAEKEPIAVRDVIRPPREELKDKNIRGHNLTVLYRCTLPQGFEVDNRNKKGSDNGYLKWFEKIPNNMLSVHDVYKDVLKEFYD